MHGKNAIILAAFGSAAAPALPGLLTLQRLIREIFPNTLIKLTFTSEMIRRIWQQRRHQDNYRHAHPDLPAELFQVQAPVEALVTLSNSGYDSVVVQPLQIAPGAEFHELARQLAEFGESEASAPQNHLRLALGRPALGVAGSRYLVAADILTVAQALAGDVAMAAREEAALLYMGHGSRACPTDAFYLQLAAQMRELYPTTPVHIALLEGNPAFDQVPGALRYEGITKVILKPLLVAAGKHVANELLGSAENSWKSVLERHHFRVIASTHGLGEEPQFGQIFVRHLLDAARDSGIELT